MQQVHLEQNINAPADAVWNTLGTQFADIDSLGKLREIIPGAGRR